MNNYYINDTETPYVINQIYVGLTNLYEEWMDQVTNFGNNKKSIEIQERMIMVYVYLNTIINNNNTPNIDVIEYQKVLNDAYSLVSLDGFFSPILGGINNS